MKASDHDDGETTAKSRNLNLTDLFVFREDWQTGVDADRANMIFIMDTNPRSLARQQYFFNSQAKYRFHVSNRAANGSTTARDASVTGVEDTRLDFSFSQPDANSVQAITLDVVRFNNGQEASHTVVSAGNTTPAVATLGNGSPAAQVNTVGANGTNLTVFAGLREDPFFFDVDAFFRTRATLAGSNPPASTEGTSRTLPGTATTAVDFAKDYNVNAIVVRVPIAFLQNGNTAATTFDVWETIAVPQNLAALPKEVK